MVNVAGPAAISLGVGLAALEHLVGTIRALQEHGSSLTIRPPPTFADTWACAHEAVEACSLVVFLFASSLPKLETPTPKLLRVIGVWIDASFSIDGLR